MKNNSDFLVTTVSGKQLLRNKCRYINKEYYEINVDCFFMPDSRWHRINNGKIEFDHEVQTYVLLDTVSLAHGIVGVEKNGNLKFGYFSRNKFKNIVVNSSECISEEIVKDRNLIEELSTGYYYSDQSLIQKLKGRENIKGIRARYSFSLDYSAAYKLNEFMEIYSTLNSEKKASVCDHSKELEDKTFGIEFETSNGFIPERFIYKHGLIPLRDGSLRHDGIEPFEFTTIPLSGDDGISNVNEITKLLRKYTEISTICSLHLHIGGYKPSYEFVVALHRLLIRIQDELYSMFPSNYRFTSQNGFKSKDYCAPIRNIKLLKNSTSEENFNRLYSYYSNNMESFAGFGMRNHPMDREFRHKWQVDLRYYIVNIIPFIWGRSGTIEFRLHSPTQNPIKIINWLFICNAILKYAEKNAKEIADFSELRYTDLASIMNSVYSPTVAGKLTNYIEWRKEYMKTIDERGVKEINDDFKEIPSNCNLLC